MYDYIEGTIKSLKSNSIVLDNNGIGYLIFVANPYYYEQGKKYKVYVFQQLREDENRLPSSVVPSVTMRSGRGVPSSIIRL